MGNTHSIPIVSQVKSVVQVAGGDRDGAWETQRKFLNDNTFPLMSQAVSLKHGVTGDWKKAWGLQKEFGKDTWKVADSIPVLGHVKGGIYYTYGIFVDKEYKEEGIESMKAATRTTGVALGGIAGAGFAVGGPFGACAGGIAGGAATDLAITEADKTFNPEDSDPYGYLALWEQMKETSDPGEWFDMAMVPIIDALTGYTAAEYYRQRTAQNAASEEPSVVKRKRARRSKKPDLDKAGRDNRANQKNPYHKKTGPGRQAGYHGDKSKIALDNHANHLNPNNPLYYKCRGGNLVEIPLQDSFFCDFA